MATLALLQPYLWVFVSYKIWPILVMFWVKQRGWSGCFMTEISRQGKIFAQSCGLGYLSEVVLWYSADVYVWKTIRSWFPCLRQLSTLIVSCMIPYKSRLCGSVCRSYWTKFHVITRSKNFIRKYLSNQSNNPNQMLSLLNTNRVLDQETCSNQRLPFHPCRARGSCSGRIFLKKR